MFGCILGYYGGYFFIEKNKFIGYNHNFNSNRDNKKFKWIVEKLLSGIRLISLNKEMIYLNFVFK